MRLTATRGSLVVETRVANRRVKPAYLVPDQCGRVTEVVLARTRFEPTGRRWTGSLQAVKRYVLAQQRSSQDPDRFQPRRPGESSSKVPPCRRPARPIRLGSGKAIDERWELPFTDAYGLAAVGSANSVVRVEVVEARRANEQEFLDMLPTGEAEHARRGRRLRLQERVSRVATRRPTGGAASASLAQLYDRLLANETLRRWLSAQPPHSWRDAELFATPQAVRFKAITSRYERAATATARADAGGVRVHLPTAADRARTWLRKPATLPPGVRLAARNGWTITRDLIPDEVELPSGRIVAGEYLLDERPLKIRVRPGRYPVRATLARYRTNRFDSVALASLVLSHRRTVRWKEAGAFAVDGGTATITSAESAAYLRRLFDRSQPRWQRVSGRAFDSLLAHDYQVTEFTLTHHLNLVMVSSGLGDGRYPVFVGLDAAGRPTRVVIDFLLLQLDWPAPND